MLIFHIRLRLCYHFLSIFLSLLLFYSHLSQALLCYLFSLFCSSLTLSTKSLLIFDLSIDKLSVFSYDSWPCALLNRQSLTFWLSSKLPSSHNLPFSISVWHISFFWFTFSLSPSLCLSLNLRLYLSVELFSSLSISPIFWKRSAPLVHFQQSSNERGVKLMQKFQEKKCVQPKKRFGNPFFVIFLCSYVCENEFEPINGYDFFVVENKHDFFRANFEIWIDVFDLYQKLLRLKSDLCNKWRHIFTPVNCST